jgi:hypothetical protein
LTSHNRKVTKDCAEFEALTGVVQIRRLSGISVEISSDQRTSGMNFIELLDVVSQRKERTHEINVILL